MGVVVLWRHLVEVTLLTGGKGRSLGKFQATIAASGSAMVSRGGYTGDPTRDSLCSKKRCRRGHGAGTKLSTDNGQPSDRLMFMEHMSWKIFARRRGKDDEPQIRETKDETGDVGGSLRVKTPCMSQCPALSTYQWLTHKPRASYGHALGLSDWRLVSGIDCVGTPE